MTEPTEQARNELSAEELAEWCDARAGNLGGVVTEAGYRMRRIAALLRAGSALAKYADHTSLCDDAAGYDCNCGVGDALRAWEAAHG